MDRAKETVVMRGERAEKVIHKDTLRMEGTFEDSTTSRQNFKQFRGDRAEVVRHEDHLKMEGELSLMSSSKDHFQGGQTGSERLPLIKPKDNLQIEGELTTVTILTSIP